MSQYQNRGCLGGPDHGYSRGAGDQGPRRSGKAHRRADSSSSHNSYTNLGGGYARNEGAYGRDGGSYGQGSGSYGHARPRQGVPQPQRDRRGHASTSMPRRAGVEAYSGRRDDGRGARRGDYGRALQGYSPTARPRGGSAPCRRGAALGLPNASTLIGSAVVIVIAAVALFAWNTRPVDIKLNGSTTSVKVGSTLDDIVSAKRLSPKKGDLVSVGGDVLQQGQGYVYSASVNGQDIDPADFGSYHAADGDDVTIGDGSNKLEDYDVNVVEEQPKLEMGGEAWGNITYISQWPKVGKREVRHGKTSGETADGDVIQETQNCVVTVHQIKPDDQSKKLIALTFDDGPADPYTEKYLSILDQYGCKATFFNLGQNIEEYPELCKKVVESGNELMSHTYQHQQLTKLDASSLQSEFSNAFDSINKVAGVQTTGFRPPYGDFKESSWLNSGGLASVSVLWNLDSEDWRRAGVDSIVSKSTNGAFSGAIILMHDGGGPRDQDVEALPQIIQALQSQGYEFVTVTDLMKSDSSIPQDIANGDAKMPDDCTWPTEIANK